MEEFRRLLKELDDNRPELNRKMEKLLKSANELLSLCEEVNEGSRIINTYLGPNTDWCIQETVDAEPLAQTTEDDANHTAAISMEKLIESANELHSLLQKANDSSRIINAYYESKMGWCIQETVDDAEPLAQTTEEEAINTAVISTSPVKHKRSPRKCQNPIQAASRMTRSIPPPRGVVSQLRELIKCMSHEKKLILPAYLSAIHDVWEWSSKSCTRA
jgi:hypothetical protein